MKLSTMAEKNAEKIWKAGKWTVCEKSAIPDGANQAGANAHNTLCEFETTHHLRSC